MDKTTVIRNVIENETKKLDQSNALLAKARAGLLQAEQIATYSYNLMHAFKNNYRLIVRAHDESKRRGDRKLAEFYEEKRNEEKGHDEWARHDLVKQGNEAQLESGKLVDGFHELFDHLEKTVDRDPRLFVGYMTYVEYMTVRMGDSLVAALEQKCGLGQGQMTAISNHAILDKDHVEDDLKVVAELFPEEFSSGPLVDEISTCARLVDRFLSQCAN